MPSPKHSQVFLKQIIGDRDIRLAPLLPTTGAAERVEIACSRGIGTALAMLRMMACLSVLAGSTNLKESLAQETPCTLGTVAKVNALA